MAAVRCQALCLPVAVGCALLAWRTSPTGIVQTQGPGVNLSNITVFGDCKNCSAQCLRVAVGCALLACAPALTHHPPCQTQQPTNMQEKDSAVLRHDCSTAAQLGLMHHLRCFEGVYEAVRPEHMLLCGAVRHQPCQSQRPEACTHTADKQHAAQQHSLL